MKKFRTILEGLVDKKQPDKLTESDAAYAASLEKIAREKKIKSLSNRDRDTLSRIADMMKNANRDDIKHETTTPDQRRKARLAQMARRKDAETHRDRMARLGKSQTEERRVNFKEYAEELQKESPNRYSPLQMAKAKKEREERRKKSGDSERNRYQRLKQRAYGNYMGGLKDDFAYIEATLEENYRTLATKGMGTETPSSANNIKKNDIEMDYYDASGSKRRGKISNIDNDTYTVRDIDDGKYRKYKFLDREKAKEYLKKENINENDMSLDDIKKKWAKEIIRYQDGDGDLSNAAEMDMFGYHGSDAIKTDDPDDFEDFVMGLQMGKYREKSGIKEASAKADAMKAIKRDRDFQKVKDVDIRATTADMKLAKKNPITQLRKILDYKGGQIEFMNKKKLKLKADDADALLRGFDALQKPADKEKYQTLISRDPASLKKILKVVKR